jgi:hypothetical protein
MSIRDSTSASRSAISFLSRRKMKPPISTFSRTVMCGNSACDWGTWVTPCRRMSAADLPDSWVSPSITAPSDGVSSPLTTRRTVDFPAPFGPTMQVIEPGSQDRSTPCSTAPPP